MKSQIILSVELNFDRDLSERHLDNLIGNSLCNVQYRLSKGQTQGNLHHGSGGPYGRFCMSRFEEMTTYTPPVKDKLKDKFENNPKNQQDAEMALKSWHCVACNSPSLVPVLGSVGVVPVWMAHCNHCGMEIPIVALINKKAWRCP